MSLVESSLAERGVSSSGCAAPQGAAALHSAAAPQAPDRLIATPTKAAATGAPALSAGAPTCAVLQLVQWRSSSLAWGWLQLALGAWAVKHAPGMRLARVMGSGRDGGFGLVPSLHRQGLIALFDREDQASDFARASSAIAARRERSSENLIVVLRAVSSRGTWSGVPFAADASSTNDGAASRTRNAQDAAPPRTEHDNNTALPRSIVASLTRASIRPRHAARFWRHAPAAQNGVRTAPGCRLAVGLGEAPLLRQATFSLWDDDAALVAYAQGGAHRAAAQGAWREHWFSESMFTRFEVLHAQGSWHGRRYG